MATRTPTHGHRGHGFGKQPSYRHDLADEFLDLARDVNATLIVIGLRHRTQVGKFITGSHALRILIQADRPVRAVNADGAGQ